MKEIFIFGSNLLGIHGKGAALYARQYCGAIYGQGNGRQGNSYAIPTKDGRLNPLPLSGIQSYVDEFLIFSETHPELTFRLTPIGTGLAGYKHSQIAPMFTGVSKNVIIPEEWKIYLC